MSHQKPDPTNIRGQRCMAICSPHVEMVTGPKGAGNFLKTAAQMVRKFVQLIRLFGVAGDSLVVTRTLGFA